MKISNFHNIRFDLQNETTGILKKIQQKMREAEFDKNNAIT